MTPLIYLIITKKICPIKKKILEITKNILYYFFYKRGRGEIGRRATLRSLWSDPWKFKSSRPHQFEQDFSLYVICGCGGMVDAADLKSVGS